MVSVNISNKPLIRCRRFGIINKKLFEERDFQKLEGSSKGSMYIHLSLLTLYISNLRI